MPPSYIKKTGNPGLHIYFYKTVSFPEKIPKRYKLTFCIGRSLTGTLQTWLLAFLNAGIAGKQTGM